MMKIEKAPIPLIVPNPDDPRLTERVRGTDQHGAEVEIKVPVERPLTLYLNAQEIVTMMTIGDYPEYLALGYLLNQNMLKYDDVVIFQHVLVQEIAERQIFRIVADRHHGDDLLRVEVQRQRPFDRDLDLDLRPMLVGAADALG